MSRKDLIVQELLDALDGVESVQEVLQRHSDSKSVLYAAIAEVLPIAQHRLVNAIVGERKARGNRVGLVQDIESLTLQRDGLQDEVTSARREQEAVHSDLAKHQPILQTVANLQAWGFTLDRLNQLHGTLNRLADAHGSSLAQATELFFDLLDGSEGVIISGLEKKRLQAETKVAENKLNDLNGELERLSDVVSEHQGALDSLNRLKKGGVSEQELATWHGFLKSIGGSAEALNQAVERYAGLEGALSQMQAKLDEQGRDKQRLAEEIKSLGHDRKSTNSELRELREQVLESSVKQGKLEKDVDHLGTVVELAQAFLTTDAEAMMRVPAVESQEMV